MPALILFHRRTIFGGDDLQPTSLLTIVVRVVQISLLCVPILHYAISHLVQIVQHQQQQGPDVGYSENDNSSWIQLVIDQLVSFAFKWNTATPTAVSDEMNRTNVKETNISSPFTFEVQLKVEQLSRCIIQGITIFFCQSFFFSCSQPAFTFM